MINSNPSIRHAPRTQVRPASILARLQLFFQRAIALLLAAGIITATPAYATPSEEDAKAIEYLITYVSQSDMIFVRNFSEYTPVRAAEHIRAKYEHFIDEIDSPETFIKLSATKSLMTGRDYRVIAPDGSKLKTGEWLLSTLEDYREKQKQANSQ